ncbi:MAG TPA: TetR/AcrR family transcriptional regulator [Myxococcaceae bacterium]|nr:TetR/AcrR family transcriptional regulator [Myxococcaceae bacterium]
MASRRRARPYHHGELRRALLDAAVALVAEHGVSGWTLREASRRLGVTHAAPYHHFASKEALLQGVAEEGFSTLAAVLRQVEEGGAADALEGVAQLGQAYVRFAAEHPSHFRVMFRTGPEGATAPSLRAIRASALQPLSAALGRASAEGQLASEEPEDAILSAWSIVHGLATLWVDGGVAGMAYQKRPLEQLTAKVTTALIEGLRRR